jgi:hypothetical protein
MPKSMFDYLNDARRFERLASLITDEEIKRLMRSQADTCHRLAQKKRRQDASAVPRSPSSTA